MRTTIRRSDIDRCPRRSLAANHYRDDGTCLCAPTKEQRAMTTANPTDDRYLDPAGVAAILGVSVATVHTYKARGVLPEPAEVFGQTPTWRESVIRAWKDARPGQGKGGGRPPKASASDAR